MDLNHLPEGTHSLAQRPGTLAGGHSKLVLAFGATNLWSNHQPAYRLTKITSARFRLRPNWSAWGDLHSQGCSGLSRTGLLFPINHTAAGDPGLAPPRLPDSESGPLLFGLNHMPVSLVLPAGLSPATWRFEATRSDTLSYGSLEDRTTRSTGNSRPRRPKEIQGGESEGRGILAGARTAFEEPLHYSSI